MDKGNAKVKLSRIINEFHLEILFAPNNMEDITIISSDVHRPGIQLSEE